MGVLVPRGGGQADGWDEDPAVIVKEGVGVENTGGGGRYCGWMQSASIGPLPGGLRCRFKFWVSSGFTGPEVLVNEVADAKVARAKVARAKVAAEVRSTVTGRPAGPMGCVRA